jgi:P4 family phage/plasmid primase-like protien
MVGPALEHLDAGISVVPITKRDYDKWTQESKGMSYPWKPFQSRAMTETEVRREFKDAAGLAVICGEVSGVGDMGEPVAGLTVLDFDVPSLYPTWAETCEAAGINVHEFPTVKTRSGGYHVYIRSTLCEGNQKLCMVEGANGGQTVGIETRGEGGLVYASPTPGYTWEVGSYSDIPTLEPEALAMLFSIARAMDTTKQEEAYEPSKVYGDGLAGERPGDVFNERADWRELLERGGATWLFRHGNRDHYLRPGKKERATGATTGNGYDGKDLLRVHSTNWPGLEAGSYSKFAYWTYTVHGGDWSKATKAAAELYGVKRKVSVPGPAEIESVGARLIGRKEPARRRVMIDADTLKQDRPLANFIYDQGRGTFLWCEAWNSWVLWTGQRWERTPSIFGLVARIVESLEDQDRELKQILGSTRRITGALPWLKTLPEVSVEPADFDANPDILNTLSGIVDLRTGEIRPHNPADRCTLLAPTEVAAEATTGSRFARFVSEVCLEREDLAKALVVWLGYSITGRVSGQKWCIGVGGGRNGKSTLVDLLRRVLGPYAAIMPTQLLLSSRFEKPTHELEALRGARFVAAEEPDHRQTLDREFIKTFTGGQAMRVRALYGKPYDMPMTGKLFLMTNHKPQVDADFAFWRRCMMVPFDYQVPEEDVNANLLSELAAESADVMAWLLEGSKEFYQNGLRITEDMRKELEDYQADNDDLRRFLDECIETDRETGVIHPTTLLTSYNAWRVANGLRQTDVKELKNSMKQKGYSTHPRGKKKLWVYVGLRIIEDSEMSSYDLRQAGLED